jgi:hypothetical protein
MGRPWSATACSASEPGSGLRSASFCRLGGARPTCALRAVAVRFQADTIASISDRDRNVRGTVIVAVLALLGFFVGAEVTLLKQHTYVWTDEFHLDHSQTAARFASVARSRHVHGIRVRAIDGTLSR